MILFIIIIIIITIIIIYYYYYYHYYLLLLLFIIIIIIIFIIIIFNYFQCYGYQLMVDKIFSNHFSTLNNAITLSFYLLSFIFPSSHLL